MLKINEGVVHEVPEDLKNSLNSNLELLKKWNSLTPLARNEWICWTGCPHRRPEAKKWFK